MKVTLPSSILQQGEEIELESPGKVGLTKMGMPSPPVLLHAILYDSYNWFYLILITVL